MPLSISTDQIDENGKELLTYGTNEFPAAFFDDDLRVVAVPWHWHEELELTYVVSGTELVRIGQDSFEVHAGEAYFVNSNVLHSADKITAECIQHCIVFHHNLLGSQGSVFHLQYLAPLLTDPQMPYAHFDKDHHQAEIDALESAWQSGAYSSYGSEILVRNNLSLILLGLCNMQQSLDRRTTPFFRTSSKKSLRMKQMIGFIQTSYMHEITIQEIADSASVSVSECLRCFHSFMEMTPVQYLVNFRLERAAALLTTTRASVTELASRVGFADLSYFSRAFKTKYGKTPLQYRKSAAGSSPGNV